MSLPLDFGGLMKQHMKIIKSCVEYLNKLVPKLDKPRALTWDGWVEWREEAKKASPTSYWLYETIPDVLHTLKHRLTDPISNTRAWVRYRTFDKYHIIKTKLKPGYQDFNERCLHGMFNMLVDYVECDLAWKSAMFDGELKKTYPWYSKGILRFKSARVPNAGVDHLKWESTLDSPNIPQGSRSTWQAEKARDILDLYHWWKYVRPKRQDPLDLSGWTQLCEDRRARGIKPLSDKGLTSADKKLERSCLDKSNAIEQSFEDEDTAQLIRLIKIRKGLWL